MAKLNKNLAHQLGWASLLVLGASAFSQACADTEDLWKRPRSSSTGGSAGTASGLGGAAVAEPVSDAGKSGAAVGGSNGGSTMVAAGAPEMSGGAPSVAGEPAVGGGDGGAGGENNAGCGVPLLIAHDANASALTLSGGYVYWTTRALAGKIMRAPVAGGTPETISASELYPYEIAVGGGHVYWAALGAQPGNLIQASVTGADRKLLASTADFPSIYGLRADENNAYFVANMNVLSRIASTGGALQRLSGGPFNSMITDVALDGTQLYWANDGVGMFVTTEPESASLQTVDTAGVTTPVALETRLDFPQFEIATDANNLYWSDESAIYRTAKVGGAFSIVTTLPVVPIAESPIVDLVSDGTNLFYSDGRTVFRVPVGGGDPEVVSQGWKRIVKLAVDDTSVYFTDSVRGAVVKLPKCASAVSSGEFDGVLGNNAPTLPNDAGQNDAGNGGCDVATSLHGCPEPTIAATATHAFGLASDASYLYFSTLDQAGNIMRWPLAGGNVESIAQNEFYPHDLTVDAQQVIWCLNDSPAHLAAAPKAGGARRELATGVGTYGVGRVVSDGKFAYYVTGFNAVYRVALTDAGGKYAIVAAGPFNSNLNDFVLHDGEVFWANDGLWNANYTAKLPGTAYFGRAPVTGSADIGHVSLKNGMDAPQYRTAADSAYVYFINKASLFRADPAGGAAVELATVPATAGAIRDMLSDGHHVYFADDTKVYRVPVSGGDVTTVTFGWGALRSLAVDDTNLYFTDYKGGLVLKQAK
jgi:hypothetical protein